MFLRAACVVATLRASGAHRAAAGASSNSPSDWYLEWKCDLDQTICAEKSKMEEWVKNASQVPADRLEFKSITKSERRSHAMYLYKFADKENQISLADLADAAREESLKLYKEKRPDLQLFVGQILRQTTDVYLRHYKDAYEVGRGHWAHWLVSLYVESGPAINVWAKCACVQWHSPTNAYRWITKEFVTKSLVQYSRWNWLKIPIQLEAGAYMWRWQCKWTQINDDPFGGENSDPSTNLGNVGTMEGSLDSYGVYRLTRGNHRFGGFAIWYNYE